MVDLVETVEEIREKLPEKKCWKMINSVVGTHKSDSTMMEYRFFEEQAGLALHAVDRLMPNYDEYTPEQQKKLDYMNEKIRPWFK